MTLKEYIQFLVAPRDISFTSNVSNSRIIENDQYVGLTCSARGNPPPVYKIRKAFEDVYEGKKTKSVYFVSGNVVFSIYIFTFFRTTITNAYLSCG